MTGRSNDRAWRGVTSGLAARAILGLAIRVGRGRSLFIRYASALLLALCSAFLQVALFPEPAIAPFVFFYPGVALSSGLGGRGPGLLCVAISAFVANRQFIRPYAAASTSQGAVIATGLFVVGGALVALICASFRLALLRMEAASRELDRRGELLRLAHDAIVVWRLDGPIEFWNEGAQQLYGFSTEEALGHSPSGLLQTSSPITWSELEKTLRAQQRWQGELRHRTKDGRTVIVSSNLQLVRGEDGVERVLEANRDVTAARQSERRLRALYDLRLIGLLYWTADGKIVDANDKFLEMTGYSRDDLTSGRLDWARMTPPQWRHLDERALEGFRTTGVSPYFEKEYIRKDGSRMPIIVGGAMLDESRVEGVAFVLDNTERKKAERALNESEERLRAIFHRAALGIAELDAGDRFVAVNDRLCEILGYGREEMLGRGINDVTVPEDRFIAIERFQELREGRIDACEYEKRCLRRDGTPLWVHVTASALRDRAGKYRGAVGTVGDIDARRAAEAERDGLLEALREADRRKNEFLGMLSHELRNPLAPIRNSLYILGRAAPGGDQARRALAVIERQVQHTSRLVDDLLDVTRVTRGKIRLQRERLELAALVARTVEDHRELFAKNGVHLELVALAEDLVVNADPTRLSQIIGNLLLNAVKFTPRGGRTTVSVQRAGTRGVIVVRDTGAGIPGHVVPHLFQPFMQAEKTLDRSAGGLGLGLALVKGLVELHGGDVSVDGGGAGNGATFVVRLPLESRGPARLTVVPTRPAAAPAQRVLIIEDNIDCAESLKEALELNEHVVDVALTGPDGVERAREITPDVVICDIGLPGIDGYQVARTLRSEPRLRRVRLIALSGYAQPEDLDRSREAGFDLHLAKPPDLDALERAIQPVRQLAGA